MFEGLTAAELVGYGSLAAVALAAYVADVVISDRRLAAWWARVILVWTLAGAFAGAILDAAILRGDVFVAVALGACAGVVIGSGSAAERAQFNWMIKVGSGRPRDFGDRRGNRDEC